MPEAAINVKEVPFGKNFFPSHIADDVEKVNALFDAFDNALLQRRS
jgi:hypothetical protein